MTPTNLFLLSAFATATTLASGFSLEPWPALAKDSHWFWLFIAAPLLGRLFGDYPAAIHALRIAAATTILYTLSQMLIEADNYLFWLRNPVFGHIRHFGLSIGFCTVLLYSAADESPYAAAFFRITRIIGLALVFWSGTRAAMLAWFVCLIALSFGDHRQMKIAVVDSIISFGLALLPPPPLPSIGLASAFRGALDARSIDSLASGRLSLWLSTLYHLGYTGEFWTGAGGNGFIRIQWLQNAAITPFGHIHPHNIVIQALCDWGIVGTLLFLALPLKLLRLPEIFTNLKRNPCATIGIIYLLVTGMFDATLYLFEFLVYLTFSLAIYLSYKSPETATTTPNTITLPRIGIIVAIVLLLVPHLLSLDYRIGFRWYFRTYDFPL